MCTDAAAEAARFGYTAVDRPEGFLVLAVASLGEEITELTSAPELEVVHVFTLRTLVTSVQFSTFANSSS